MIIIQCLSFYLYSEHIPVFKCCDSCEYEANYTAGLRMQIKFRSRIVEHNTCTSNYLWSEKQTFNGKWWAQKQNHPRYSNTQYSFSKSEVRFEPREETHQNRVIFNVKNEL